MPLRMNQVAQSALEKAVNQEKLFPSPGHQAFEPVGIDNPFFRKVYDADFPLGGKLGDWIPPMAAAEGLNKGAQGLAEGNYGSAAFDTGLAMLDAADPSPIPWTGLAGVGMTAWHGSPVHPLDMNPIIIGRNKDGSQYIADGNHRYWDAMDRGDSTIMGHMQPEGNLTLSRQIEALRGNTPIEFNMSDIQPLLRRELIRGSQ